MVVTEPGAPSATASTGENGAQVTTNAPATKTICAPIQQPGVGGSGNSAAASQNPSSANAAPNAYDTNANVNAYDSNGNAMATPPPATTGSTVNNDNRTTVSPTYVPAAPPPAYAEKAKRHEADMRGLTVLAGGGVEAYSGVLGPRVNPGAAWGVTAAFKPTKVFGIELGYTGAANDIAHSALTASGTSGAGGPDIIRNGGQAALTFGLTSTAIQPYALGGVGIDRYDVRGGQAAGFKSDTAGSVPVGGGVRAHWGHFTADARGLYDFTFNSDFATGVAQTSVAGSKATTNAGRYGATMSLGATF